LEPERAEQQSKFRKDANTKYSDQKRKKDSVFSQTKDVFEEIY